MGVQKEAFGKTEDGCLIERYTLTNRSGASVSICTMGAAIQSLRVPDRNGCMTDVVPGFDTGEAYCRNTPHFGAIIGPCCNRIRGAAFELDEKRYFLTPNSGENHIHGGAKGFDTKNWQGHILDEHTVMLKLLCPDGEDGYPGNVQVKVFYSWNEDNCLTLQYQAVSDQKTIFNPTSHTYFNLNGHGTILDHKVILNASQRLELDSKFLPTGNLLEVSDTVYDLRSERALCSDGVDATPKSGCYLLDSGENAACVWSEKTGICMDLQTTLPFLVFYTGYAVKLGTKGKAGREYGPYCGLCLETSYPVDAIHHPDFIQFTLEKGQVLQNRTSFSFRTV